MCAFAAGLAYSNLVYDWVKAAVMFGVINTVATLDHLDPPQPPKCITMLYVFAETYVQLWLIVRRGGGDDGGVSDRFCSSRHFDRGINDWLCK